MADFRARPYSAFNFLIKLGDEADPNSPYAGFQEITGLGLEITVQEYRAGNSRENSAQKITGTHKVTDVTCKRGVIGALDLYEWLSQVRDGSQDSLRTVLIQLMSEDHNTVALSWRLTNARPIKYTAPAFNGKGTDVAVEELVLAAERIDME